MLIENILKAIKNSREVHQAVSAADEIMRVTAALGEVKAAIRDTSAYDTALTLVHFGQNSAVVEYVTKLSPDEYKETRGKLIGLEYFFSRSGIYRLTQDEKGAVSHEDITQEGKQNPSGEELGEGKASVVLVRGNGQRYTIVRVGTNIARYMFYQEDGHLRLGQEQFPYELLTVVGEMQQGNELAVAYAVDVARCNSLLAIQNQRRQISDK